MLAAKLKVAIVAGAVAVAFIAGWKVNGWRHAEQREAELKEMAEYKEAFDELSRDLVKTYNEKEAKQVIVYREIKKEIQNVTDNRICFADAGALSLWNQAVTGVPETAAGTTDQAAGTDTATDKEVLENAVENFEQYTKARNQLNKLIDFHELKVKE